MKHKHQFSLTTFLNTHWFTAIFVLIVIFSAIVRFYKLGEIPVSLYWDEAAMLVDAKAIAQTGHDMHGNHWLQAMFPSYGDYKLPVYIWLASLSVKLFGVSEWALRLPSALVGVAQVGAIGIFATIVCQSVKARFRQILILSVMFVIAVSPWSVLFSRTGFEGHVGQFLLLCSLIAIAFSQRKSVSVQRNDQIFKVLLLLLSAVLGALAVYAYYSVRFVWPVVMIAYFVLLSPTSMIRVSLKPLKFSIQFQPIITLVATLLIWLILLIPLSTSPHYQASQTYRLSTDSVLQNETEVIQSNVYREMSGNGIFSRLYYHRYWLTSRELMKNYSAHVDLNYLFLTGDSNLRHGTGRTGVFQLWMMPMFLIGVYGLARNHWKVLLFVGVWWMVALLPASVPNTVPHALRSLNALTPLVLMIGYGLAVSTNYAVLSFSKQKKLLFKSIFILFITLITIGNILFLHDYFSHYSQRSAYDWQDGYKQVTELIKAEKSTAQSVWVNPDDGRLYLWLMIYDDYTGQDFQNWKSIGYQFQTFGNVRFKPFDWSNVEGSDQAFIIVERPGMLRGTPKRVQEVKDTNGKVRFEAGWYGR